MFASVSKASRTTPQISKAKELRLSIFWTFWGGQAHTWTKTTGVQAADEFDRSGEYVSEGHAILEA